MKHNPVHVLKAELFDRPFLDHICKLTDRLRQFDKSKEGLLFLQSLLPEKRAMLYFTQPSTRTFLSFESACHIMGIRTSEIRDPETSSEMKGETVLDSLRTFSSYVDLIIMRSPLPHLAEEIATLLNDTQRPIPVINAGSGKDQHPTQALLDLYTLQRSFKNRGGIEGKTIAMVGDLKRGRTIRSLSILLRNFRNVNIIFVSPSDYAITEDLRSYLASQKNLSICETTDFEAAISKCDAVYMTRIQDEYDSYKGESKANIFSNFHFQEKHLSILPKESVILHPMPRREELDIRVDKDPRARYWRQERNGMWVRAALMAHLFQVDHHIIQPEL